MFVLDLIAYQHTPGNRLKIMVSETRLSWVYSGFAATSYFHWGESTQVSVNLSFPDRTMGRIINIGLLITSEDSVRVKCEVTC